MSTIVTRNGKGTALTWTEMDDNFTNLNNDKYEAGDDPTFGTVTAVAYAGIVGVTDGDKGDITVAGSGASWTIDNSAVTYAKIQNVSAASKLLGRGDSGSGAVQEITLGGGLSMSGTTLSVTGGGTAAGSDTEIQFNTAGSLDADANFTFNYTASYSTILTLGTTFGTAWSNTILPVSGIENGDRGALVQYSGSNYLYWNTKINSAYAEVARTTSGTPASLDVGGGAITLRAAASNPGAGSAITFTTLMTARGNSDMDVSLNCGRLKFPATQNPSSDANTLDDYEEGTWTVGTSTTNLTISGTTSATYTKIGNVVHLWAEVEVTNSGAARQAITITGLPFTSGAAAAVPPGVVNTAIAVAGMGYITSGSTSIEFKYSGNNINAGANTFILTAVYRV